MQKQRFRQNIFFIDASDIALNRPYYYSVFCIYFQERRENFSNECTKIEYKTMFDCMYGCMDVWIYGCKVECMYGCMDECMYGWMDIWMYG